MKGLNKYLIDYSQKSGHLDFPGFRLQAFLNGQRIANIQVGQTYLYYDLASLTKILFTTSLFVDLVSEKKLSLATKVNQILPWYQYDHVKVGNLLNHSAGNTWWMPFYKKINLDFDPEQKFLQFQRLCRQAPITRNQKAVYSDIDFYLLGAIMEKVSEKPLIALWDDYKEKYLPKSRLHFNYKNKSLYKKESYAPTEKCSWRRKIMQGEVHDENAWAMGGVAPQAGLFGRIEDLSEWGLLMRQSYLGKKGFLNPEAFKKFSQRSLPSQRGDWAYGFMMPSQGGSSAGDYFSKKSVGHTGFTGISLWFDPVRDLLVTLVSNRVHPKRSQKGFVRLRPQLHNQIVEFIERSK
ncbi:MAG: serine hydrolase [Bdellovibrionales bacterium]|nr:serine hydrolase [Bdellovibrionales bacterium]NQZ17994.1 serine hydrolase [Bdellovibrionales bacterium]